MNRIILIGNGFDLAHGLPTSYQSFINDFWKQIVDKVINFKTLYEDHFIYLESKYPSDITFKANFPNIGVNSYQDFKNCIPIDYFKFAFKNSLLDRICSHYENLGWSGIENDFYNQLKEVAKIKNGLKEQTIELNKELASIQDYLKIYLKNAEEKTVISDDVISEITEKIYLSFKFEDVSITYRKRLIESLFQYITLVFSNFVTPSVDSVIPIIKQRFLVLSGYDNIQLFQILEGFFYRKTLDEQVKYIESKISIKQVFIDILYPEKFLLLDFNYTNTTVKYNHPDTDIIHIHGELNNPKNPMIFGYGDEIGEDYKKIEDLEENELLKNVKSIRYQDTNNYQRLMEFIESDYYQVFVMGHSCGNSDRTLLNTLFEHENCLSIKPYYYQFGENAEDSNYSDIVRNISRNFRDKPAMRNKVVNKTYCEPLLGYKKK